MISGALILDRPGDGVLRSGSELRRKQEEVDKLLNTLRCLVSKRRDLEEIDTAGREANRRATDRVRRRIAAVVKAGAAAL